MKHYNITISGYVQGVGFRYSARDFARKTGINGFAKNIQGNKVCIEAEGDEVQLSEFINWCHKGPAHAIVDNVIIEQGEMKQYDGFEISF